MSETNKPLFVIDNDPIVPWPVTVILPATGGTFEEYQFTALMRVLAPDEYERLFKDAPDARKLVVDAEGSADKAPRYEARDMSEILQGNVPIFQRLITGWEGVNDRSDNAVAYTPEKLAEQITGPCGPALSTGIWRAINELRYGKRLDDGTQQDGAALGN